MSLQNLPNSIDIRLRASHLEPFINKNALKYSVKGVKRGKDSWTFPYPKPQLIGHNKQSDPIGRVISSRVIKHNDDSSPEPQNYLELTVRITESSSIEKILDGRYNTVSVGSRTTKVTCSDCGTVLTEEGLCEHQKGSYNDKGELIHWIIDQIEYVEDSFVNEPADEWARIDSINIGAGWVAYNLFMDNRDSLLSELILKDTIVMAKNAKLSSEARSKLPETSFAGPGRSFPAHDAAHVKAGLELIGKSEFSDETKAKITAGLYRKGQRYGIVPSNDELAENPDLLTARLEDDWTAEETQIIEDYFTANPDADLPEDATEGKEETNTADDSQEETTDISKMKVADLRELVAKLQQEIEDTKAANKEAIDARDKKITALETKVQDTETVSLQREDEINGYLDKIVVLEKKFRDSVISNVIDLKMTDNNNEDINELRAKLSKRQTESLNDTLEDLRSGLKSGETDTGSSEKVEDSTLQTETENSETQNKDKLLDDSGDKFSVFNIDRSSITED
jgi:hypothetical protein